MNYVILEKANKVKTLAVDFDGTIVKANKVSPLKTKLLPGVKKGMEQFKKDGWTLIIYTARPNNELKEIKEFLKKNDIPFDYINENPLQPQPNPGKLYCDVMLDDKVVTFKNWDSAYNDVINQRKKLDKVRPKEKKVLECRRKLIEGSPKSLMLKPPKSPKPDFKDSEGKNWTDARLAKWAKDVATDMKGDFGTELGDSHFYDMAEGILTWETGLKNFLKYKKGIDSKQGRLEYLADEIASAYDKLLRGKSDIS